MNYEIIDLKKSEREIYVTLRGHSPRWSISIFKGERTSNRELPITRNDTLLVIHEEILKSCRPSKRPFHGVKFPNNRAIYDSQGGFIVRVETAVSRLKFTIVVTRRNHGARCNKTAGNCSLPMLSVPSFSRPQKNSLAGSVSRTPRRRG